MKNLQLLYQLVHRMTPDEHLYLEKLLLKDEGGMCRKLTNILLDMSAYEENTVIYKWSRYGKKYSRKALYNTSHRTKDKILQAIHLSMAGAYPDSSDTIAKTADAYMQKQLFEEAYNILRSFLERQAGFISPVEELQFLHKMLSLAPLVVRTNLDTVHDDLLQQCDKTLQHIQLYHRIHRLNHQVGLLYIKEANKKAQPEEIHTVLSAWEELSKIPSEHHATHSYFLKTTVMFMQLRYAFEKQAEAQLELAGTMRSYYLLYKTSPHYLKFLAEQINAGIILARSGDREAFEELTEFLQLVLQEEHVLHDLLRMQLWFIQSLFHYYRRDIQQMLQYLAPAHHAFMEQRDKLPVTVQPALRLGLMKCWLLADQHRFIAKLFEERPAGKPLVKLDLYLVMHLIYLCSLYLRFTYNVLSGVVTPPQGFMKQVNRFTSEYQLSKDFLPVEYSIHGTFTQLAKADISQNHIRILQRLRKKLSKPEVAEARQTEAFLRTFSLDDWITDTIYKLEQLK